MGQQAIQVYVAPHERDAYRIQGYYILLNNSEHKIQIVGEPLEGVLEVEESANGIDITGVWEIKFPAAAADTGHCFTKLEGSWQDADFKNPQPLTLTRQLSW